jgi:hypothetical protein
MKSFFFKGDNSPSSFVPDVAERFRFEMSLPDKQSRSKKLNVFTFFIGALFYFLMTL